MVRHPPEPNPTLVIVGPVAGEPLLILRQEVRRAIDSVMGLVNCYA